MKDLIYYYDKTTFQKYELGEIQCGFNQSFVIDGTKDSNKVEVWSFNGKTIEPNTIVFHRATQTWWIVAHDKVERYQYENNPLYKHNLKLEGAIELFNARDLTDCGFNDNTYDVDTFIKRLVSMSNFEFNHTDYNSLGIGIDFYIAYQNNIAREKIVDYIKTFENYTLLSALREFLDGYNCSPKLEFIENVSGQIVSARLVIVSKTGNVNSIAINGEDVFKDPRETKNMDKNNFGTSVVSNAENVVSTKAKTYPSVGGVRFSSEQYKIEPDNAIIRLPSNVFKVNWIKIHKEDTMISILRKNIGNDPTRVFSYNYNSASDFSMQTAINNLIDYLENTIQAPSQIIEEARNINILTLSNYGDLTAQYTDNYNPTTNKFIYDYSAINFKEYLDNVRYYDEELIFTNEETRNNIERPQEAIYFKRGQNYIKGFDFLKANKETLGGSLSVTINRHHQVLIEWSDSYADFKIILGNYGWTSSGTLTNIDQTYYFKKVSVSVNYIPMSDLKIKYDNDGDTIDTNLFNQNGKLSDSNALSKVLLSHSKEIESDTITRYGTFYGKYSSSNGYETNLPKVGDLVYINNDYYVINNISLDFEPNESINTTEMGYYITAEVSMSKKVATKSMLTNPNTNIRDYGIPQNNNVKRKQVYRDFYEFAYEHDNNSTKNWYLPINKVLNLSNGIRQYQEHIGVISCRFSHEVNESDTYYYQLETTTYFMKKAVYEIVDFKDNNIIGYGYQNLWSGFDISRFLLEDGWKDLYSTPISYVDETGEIEEINIRFATIEQLTNVYDNTNFYDKHHTYNTGDIVIIDNVEWECNQDNVTGNWDSSKWTNKGENELSIYNASLFIPKEIYQGLHNNCDFEIKEEYYKKDALEVPVFEYCCQIDDTSDISIGENILSRGNNDVAYMYQYQIVDNGTLYNDNNYDLQTFNPVIVNSYNEASVYSAVQFDETHLTDQEPYLLMKLYGSQVYDIESEENVSLANEIDLDDIENKESKALIIVRHNITSDDIYSNVVGELALNTPQANLPTPDLGYKNKIVVLNDGNYHICQPDQYNLHIDIDPNCVVKLTLIRDGIYIYNQNVIESDTSHDIEVFEGDSYEIFIDAQTNYYCVGSTYLYGTIHDGNVSYDILIRPYQTISLTKHQGVSRVIVFINSTRRYELTENGQLITELRQDDTYSFSTELESGYEIVSGGSGSGTIGANQYNVKIIEPIVQLIPKVNSATLGGIHYETPGSWTSTLSVFPNFHFSSAINFNNVNRIVVKMTIYSGIGSGQVQDTLYKTYYKADLTLDSSTNTLQDYNNRFYPIVNWDYSKTLSRTNGLTVSNGAVQSAQSCKIEISVYYNSGDIKTTSIGSSTATYMRYDYDNYYGYYAGQTAKMFRIHPVGENQFDNTSGIARWYIFS